MINAEHPPLTAPFPQPAGVPGLLHIHFGAGRLGLGLVPPFLRTPQSELHILNRRIAAAKETGVAGVTPQRRNTLLEASPTRRYVIETAGAQGLSQEAVPYDGFHTYDDDDLERVITGIASGSSRVSTGVVVTASILTLAAYACVVRALAVLCARAGKAEGVGPIFLVACENTLGAGAVMNAPELAHLVTPEVLARVVCVEALVDRMCVELQEGVSQGEPTLIVHAEAYGELTLQLTPQTARLRELCAGSRVRFSRHVEVEKQIKGWLLNGGHNLIAVEAFRAADGDRTLKLNEFLSASEDRRRYAYEVMDEMRTGIAALLRRDPAYAEFLADVDLDAYLTQRAAAMLERFIITEDPITRILGRFQAPGQSVAAVQAFAQRLASRIDPPLEAYEAVIGIPPPAAHRAIFSLYALIATGKFVDAELDPASPVLSRAEAAVAPDAVNDFAPAAYIFGAAPRRRREPGAVAGRAA